MIVDEEKVTETDSSSVPGTDIIISEPEGGKGNKYHKAKDGRFTSPDEGEASGSEPEAVSGSETKPTLSSIISKHKPKLNLVDIINRHRGESAPPQEDPNDWNNIISLKNFRKTQELIFKANSATDLTEVQIKNLENKMNPIIKNAMLGCNFNFSNILDFIKSNQILNQFAVGGRSGGYSARPESPSHERCRMSNVTFGSEGIFFNQGLSHEEVMANRRALEKYGCLMDNNPYGATTNRLGTQYGDSFWIMNDSVKSRSTFTIGDSLVCATSPTTSRRPSAIPMPINEGFNYRQLGKYGESDYHRIMRDAKDVHSLVSACGRSYLEAQMHGELLIDRDVFGCCARPRDWNSSKGREAMIKLNEMGIKTFTHREGNNFLEEIILNPDGSFDYRKVE